MLERHFHQYITNHLNDHHPLSNKHWGFQSGKSTVAALFSVTNDLFHAKNSNLDKKCVPFLFFFDLKKAFDSVPHHQLLDLLAWYRLDTHTLSWITGYFINRKQHEVIDRETSSEIPVLSGILQG